MDQPSKIRVNHRLTAANGDDRRPAFIECLQALFHCKLFPDRVRVFTNAAAAGACEIARMQGFEHHDERKFINATQAFTRDVSGHAGGQTNWKSQSTPE